MKTQGPLGRLLHGLSRNNMQFTCQELASSPQPHTLKLTLGQPYDYTLYLSYLQDTMFTNLNSHHKWFQHYVY